MPGPVHRAEDFYLPPPELPAEAWDQAPAAERVVRWMETKAQRRIATPPRDVVIGTAYAYINHGRWVADCPCGSAQVVTPADPALYCVDCLPDGWLTLIFPADCASAEAEVAELPKRERNWRNLDEDTNPSRKAPEPEAKTRG